MAGGEGAHLLDRADVDGAEAIGRAPLATGVSEIDIFVHEDRSQAA